MILREYQAAAVESLWQWFTRHETGNPILSLPTGSGKSVIVAEICRQALTQWPGSRILMTVKSQELCQQNAEKMLAVWPDAPLGIHSASLGRKDLGNPIMFSTIGSVWKKAHLLGHIDLIIIDEVHMVSTKEEGMYRALVADIKKYCPGVRVIGLTATPFRGNGVWLSDGEDPLFTGIAASVSMRELLDAGYLAPLVAAKTTTIFDAEGIPMQHGDYNIRQLAARVDKEHLVQQACEELCRLGGERKHWIIFGVTIKHCEHIAQTLQGLGVDARVISTDTTKEDRRSLIAAFKAGDIRALVSVNALSVGFDAPATDLVALMRNTRSPVFYVQAAGRGMRTAPGKVDAAWLDFTDTTAALGPVDAIKGRARPRTQKEAQAAPSKVCPECSAICATATLECIDCGYQFPEPERIKHDTRVNGAAVMSNNSRVKTFDVSEVSYAEHRKEGKPPSLRVEYWSGMRKAAAEWLCFEHSGYARGKAIWTWREMGGQEPPPESVDEALARTHELRRVVRVMVDQSGDFADVVGREYSGTNDSRGDVSESTSNAAEGRMPYLHPF